MSPRQAVTDASHDVHSKLKASFDSPRDGCRVLLRCRTNQFNEHSEVSVPNKLIQWATES